MVCIYCVDSVHHCFLSVCLSVVSLSIYLVYLWVLGVSPSLRWFYGVVRLSTFVNSDQIINSQRFLDLKRGIQEIFLVMIDLDPKKHIFKIKILGTCAGWGEGWNFIKRSQLPWDPTYYTAAKGVRIMGGNKHGTLKMGSCSTPSLTTWPGPALWLLYTSVFTSVKWGQ